MEKYNVVPTVVLASFDRQHIHRVAHVLADGKRAPPMVLPFLQKRVREDSSRGPVHQLNVFCFSAEKTVLLVRRCSRIYDVTSNELEPFAERRVATSPAKSESSSTVTRPGQT